jgi:uncharacterized membrane protein YhiD involved in acid resistance
MNEALLVGLGSLATAILGAGAGAVVLIVATLHKNRQERESSAGESYKSIIDRQEKRIIWLEQQVERQQSGITRIADRLAECEAQRAEIHAYLVGEHATVTRLALILTKLGHDPGPVSAELPIRGLGASEEAEFIRRTTEHDSGLMRGTSADGSSTGNVAPERKTP